MEAEHEVPVLGEHKAAEGLPNLQAVPKRMAGSSVRATPGKKRPGLAVPGARPYLARSGPEDADGPIPRRTIRT